MYMQHVVMLAEEREEAEKEAAWEREQVRFSDEVVNPMVAQTSKIAREREWLLLRWVGGGDGAVFSFCRVSLFSVCCGIFSISCE